MSLYTIVLLGQNGHNDTIVIRGEPINKYYESIYFIIDTLTIELISEIETLDINPKWIRKIEAVKDEKYKNIYFNGGANIYIYPKRRFRDELLKALENEKTVPNTR